MLGLLPGSNTERQTFGLPVPEAAAGPADAVLVVSILPALLDEPENQLLNIPIVKTLCAAGTCLRASRQGYNFLG